MRQAGPEGSCVASHTRAVRCSALFRGARHAWQLCARHGVALRHEGCASGIKAAAALRFLPRCRRISCGSHCSASPVARRFTGEMLSPTALQILTAGSLGSDVWCPVSGSPPRVVPCQRVGPTTERARKQPPPCRVHPASLSAGRSPHSWLSIGKEGGTKGRGVAPHREVLRRQLP